MSNAKQCLIGLLALGPLLFFSCGDEGSQCPSFSESIQDSLNVNYADELIIPAFEAFVPEFNNLSESVIDYLDSGDESLLIIAQESFKTTYESWQSLEPFTFFGPGDEQLLYDNFNLFPFDRDSFYLKYFELGYNGTLPDVYVKGLPALDYFLFEGGEESVNERLFLNEDASQLQEYIRAMLADMLSRVSDANELWKTSYRDAFVANLGRADGSALAQLHNAFNQHFEGVKRDRVGLPSGVLSLNFTAPTVVEAYHSNISNELLYAALSASKRFFEGVGYDEVDRIGLKEILRDIDFEKAGEELSSLISTSYDDCFAAIALITDPMSQAVDTQNDIVVDAYLTLSDQVILTKTDMSSAMCVEITYIDKPIDTD